MNRNILDVSGRSELVGACEQVLTNRRLDLVVVRNCVTVVELDEIHMLPGNDAGSERLRDIVPEVEEVDALVNAYWRAEGYSDYAIDPKLRPSYYKSTDESSTAHRDELGLKRGLYGGMAAGLSMSVAGGAVDASAIYRARRPKKPFSAPDGSFDRALYEYECARARAIHLVGGAKIVQSPTDFVLFPQHPYAALHAVKSRNGRWAKMLDYFARERAPFV
ncbi:MAG TPA: hypothetical protein PKA02_02715 [Candidatus Saccharibacteria bacterium]|nr:hypothetical protein [Candidatus Saccharibacteria bacterium]